MESKIIASFCKFLVLQPPGLEFFFGGLDEIHDIVKTDVCYLLSFHFSTILGEMDPKIAVSYAAEVKEALEPVLPDIWAELTRLGADSIEYMDNNPAGTDEATDNLIQLYSVFVCYQCLLVFSDVPVDDQHTQASPNSRI